jgi:hypothetical protein
MTRTVVVGDHGLLERVSERITEVKVGTWAGKLLPHRVRLLKSARYLQT